MSSALIRSKTNRSQPFLDFVQRVGDTKSKLEEEKVIRDELLFLKNALKTIDPSSKEMHETLLRAFYCELLGYTGDFAHIHAIKHIPSVYCEEKKTGYMLSLRFLAPGHEFLYLMISNLQKDLKSSNFLELGAALDTVANITESEIASVFIDDVKKLCAHENAFVRKKAFVAAFAYAQKENIQLQSNELYRVGLSDSDPQVMNVALCLMEEVVRRDPKSHQDTIPSLINILSQITEHRLLRTYDFHRIPAPWTQIRILKIMRILIQSDLSKLSACTDVLVEVIKRSDVDLSIGDAVIYEAICTISSVEAPKELLDIAAKYTSKYISSSDCNQVFVGINALSLLVAVDVNYAIPHQHTLIDLLEDEDQSIRTKSIKLLCAMTSIDNIELISDKLIEFLKDCIDEDQQALLVSHLFSIIDEFYIDEYWFIDAMCEVITCGSKHISQDMIQKVLQLIAHSVPEENGAVDSDVRLYAVRLLYQLIENRDLGDPITKIAVWAIGEYSFLDESKANVDVLERLCDVIRRPHLNTQTKSWVITASLKVVARESSLADQLTYCLREIMQLGGEDLLSECFDALELLEYPGELIDLLPLDGSCGHGDLDLNLTFLDPYIQEAIQKGKSPFDEQKMCDDEREDDLRFDSYENGGDVDENGVNDVASRIANEVTLTARVNKWSREAVQQREKENDIEPVCCAANQEDRLTNDENPNVENNKIDLTSANPLLKVEVELTKKEKFAQDIFLPLRAHSRKVESRRNRGHSGGTWSRMENRCTPNTNDTIDMTDESEPRSCDHTDSNTQISVEVSKDSDTVE